MPDWPPSPMTEAELAQWFPLQRPRLGDDVFELGLVLGGTVSAGAYTAGVLDFLIEALDAWTLAREKGEAWAPAHRVVISTIGGTSGGAVNGAILLRAAGWSFPHGTADDNPFYNSWTTGVDLMSLLSAAAEPGASGFASAFNCSAIDAQAARTVAYSGGPLGTGGAPGQRIYFSDPLRLFTMVGNLTGIPYRIKMRGESVLSHDMVSHGDFMRFALAVDGGIANPPCERPDEVPLHSHSATNWDRLQAASVATSAFPLAFRPRPLQRPVNQARYRATLIPGGTGADTEVAQLIPLWDALVPDGAAASSLNFVNVDGGTMNNEPVDVVRTALAGMNGRNVRSGDAADRAVILIDPFSDPETLGPTEPQTLIRLVWPLINAWIYQARFKPADIALAYAEDVFSRFLIAPVGPGPDGTRTIGKSAIAAGGLGGFLGFVDRRFLAYDYRLGRRNAWSFIDRHFSFPETNPVFQTYWTQAQRDAQAVDETNGVRNIRMIPLAPGMAEPPAPTKDDWPRLSAMPAALPAAIEGRLQAVYEMALSASQPDGWLKRALVSGAVGFAWWAYGRGALRDKALDVIRRGLRDQKLL